jgi:hypothetical protein
MLANDGIKLLDLHLFRHVLLVFGRGVEMTSAGTGYQFDLVAHDLLLKSDFIAALADIRENGVDALLVDGAKSMAGYAQAHPTVFAFYPEPMLMQIRVEDSLGLVVSVRDVMAYNTALARHLAYSGHDEPRFAWLGTEKPHFICHSSGPSQATPPFFNSV